jgi:hypothetical protein
MPPVFCHTVMRRANASTRKPVGNAEFKVGDLVRWHRGEGTVVGIIERGEFSESESAHRWRALQKGVLVRSDDGDMHHFRDASTVLQHR